ncbi:polysaccharide biosynthesis/export family protein [Sphingomonas pruni]|uniref:polysaccharide biosynthesis/export family protein n=1 Tax=Sphingomonas pruni TaxID=40683 RepID=UPI000B11B09D|nr:polysaccharide biosynthesis/export family protein [Sphingomonas pruni]
MSAATAETELPVPSVQDMTRDQADYRIGPLDKLTVTVFGVPDLTTNGQVDGTGNLAMPLIGQVPAIGETPLSLSGKIAAALDKRYVRNPQVSVTVTEAVSALVTVEGAVIKSGQYPVVGRTTLIRMIAAAGGPSDNARLSEALVFRTVNGKRLVARFNLKDIRGARASDPEIYGNDLIVVGDNPGRQLFKDLVSIAPVLGIFYQITRK